VRVNAAAQALTRTEDSVTAIAQNAGFYDHSHFTKQFKKHKNMTPTQYRQRYAQPA
jgi:AraC-like DNA-binding protein